MAPSFDDNFQLLSHRHWPDENNSWLRILVVACSILLVFLLNSLRIALKPGLKSLPGLLWARFSSLYRISMVWKGKAPERYLQVHRKYGPIVRIGPNAVSIYDAGAIPILYGISTRFVKVCFIISSNFYALILILIF
jgi:hypothetical protein